MPEISEFNNLDEVEQKCAALIVARAAEAIEQRGGFSLVLSGGSTPKSLYALLASPEISRVVDWEKVHFFWGDERCVPPEHPASNFKMAHTALLSKITVAETQIHRMKGEMEPQAGARDYENLLRDTALLWKDQNPAGQGSLPTFDLVLLGLGNDGHTASLFPGSKALAEKSLLVCAVPAPAADPAVPRLTLSLPVLNNAREVWFITAGPRKREIVETILAGNGRAYPAALIKPHGKLHWFLSK